MSSDSEFLARWSNWTGTVAGTTLPISLSYAHATNDILYGYWLREAASASPQRPPLPVTKERLGLRQSNRYGRVNWDAAIKRVCSELGDPQAVRADLRRELVSGVRKWPRCQGHDQDCQVVYRQQDGCHGEPSVYLRAAFACRACERGAPTPRPVP
jgi:hypothetical protein